MSEKEKIKHAVSVIINLPLFTGKAIFTGKGKSVYHITSDQIRSIIPDAKQPSNYDLLKFIRLHSEAFSIFNIKVVEHLIFYNNIPVVDVEW